MLRHLLINTLKQKDPDWEQVDNLVTDVFDNGSNSTCIHFLQILSRAIDSEQAPESLITKLLNKVLSRSQPWGLEPMPIVQKQLDYCSKKGLDIVIIETSIQGIPALNHAVIHHQTDLAELLIDHFIHTGNNTALFETRTRNNGYTPFHLAIS